ncbi:hypothetical protein AN639_00880 [Candidatus Epulonipiscium fishelsonii]|uniref:Uncharacterized protein n=1 Tax=Candidatus Epulonipiscium fishelsonii TaxID=77094 RepID=A0ACC8XC85_9FIRM|nr:hypothetical protein AN396_01320 [Epulopiscium sp. SCG-B11WGA-EpuloA1]ONI41350.1 hypothetical protein AN639_00880 [Epulopiscium sp. SCG-B05WGA-EpuloA1]
MKSLKTDIIRLLLITVGSSLMGLATNGVLVPNKLLSGGISGIAMILYFLYDINISLVLVVCNIPLFILGIFFLKRSFLAYSLYGMLMLSFWIEVTQSFKIPMTSELSVAVVGGILNGVGMGIIFRADASSGGIDILAKIANKYFSISMASVSLMINAVILGIAIFFFGIDIAVLTLSTMFVASCVTNFVVDGVNQKRTLFIITDEEHYKSISNKLLIDLHRGVTIIPAIGAFTNKRKYILYTNIGIRELAKVKSIVISTDKHAFVTVSAASQVIGRGKGFTMASAIEQVNSKSKSHTNTEEIEPVIPANIEEIDQPFKSEKVIFNLISSSKNDSI